MNIQTKYIFLTKLHTIHTYNKHAAGEADELGNRDTRVDSQIHWKEDDSATSFHDQEEKPPETKSKAEALSSFLLLPTGDKVGLFIYFLKVCSFPSVHAPSLSVLVLIPAGQYRSHFTQRPKSQRKTKAEAAKPPLPPQPPFEGSAQKSQH